MQTKFSVIRKIIIDDFGCDECTKKAKCPIYRGKRNSVTLPSIPALPCLGYTYERAMLLMLDALANMPRNEAIDIITKENR